MDSYKSRYEAAREARRQCVRAAIQKEEESTGIPLTYSFPGAVGKVVEWVKGDPSFETCKTDQSRLNAVRRILRELRGAGQTKQVQPQQSGPEAAIVQPGPRTRMDNVLAAAKALSISERFELLKGIVDLVEADIADVQQEMAFNKMRLAKMREQEKFLEDRIRALSNGTMHRVLALEKHMATPGN